MSADGGVTWRGVKLKESETSPVAVLADRRRPGLLVVRTGVEENGGRGSWGGWAYVTRDGGKRWREVAVPDGWQHGDNGDVVSAIAVVDGDIDHLLIWKSSDVGPQDRWESVDGGKKWKKSASKVVVPQDTFEEARLGEVRYQTSPDGLLRIENGGETRLYPH